MKKQIEDYIASQPEPKQSDMRALHRRILKAMMPTRLQRRYAMALRRQFSSPLCGLGRRDDKESAS
jgi:hypothetical protein